MFGQNTTSVTSANRRAFLKHLGVGVGAGGLTATTVSGRLVETKELVVKENRKGVAVETKQIPKERYRRLKVYEHLPINTFVERFPIVNSVSLTRQSGDPTDLALVLYVDRDTPAIRQQLPGQIQNVPTVVEERPIDRTYTDCTDNCLDDDDGDLRYKEFYDPLLAGTACRTTATDGKGSIFVLDDDHDTGEKFIITAEHLAETGSGISDYLYHPWDGISISTKGDYRTASDYDSIAYKHDGSDSSIDIGASYDSLPTIVGFWTWSGIVDKTDSGTIDVELSGAEDDHITNKANATQKSDQVSHEVNYKYNNAEVGNSGAPWVDPDGYLVSMQNFCQCDWTDNHWDAGACAKKLLQDLNMTK